MFILAKERDIDAVKAFRIYRAYLEKEQKRFPPGALSLARSDWYFDFGDHRSPHDAWLDQAILNEVARGDRKQIRHASLTLSLLGAYHDLILEFRYPRVYNYDLLARSADRGHADWRYDEFRLSDSGHLIHEIEWWGPTENAVWLIEADDVSFSYHPYVEAS